MKALGGDPNADPRLGNRRATPTLRTGSEDTNPVFPPGTNPNDDQTFVGIFWAYDASAYLCAPPRLYNMIATSVALRELPIERVEDFAHYLAFINTTMADAGLAAWDGKYFFVYPRPVTYIREVAADGTPRVMAGPALGHHCGPRPRNAPETKSATSRRRSPHTLRATRPSAGRSSAPWSSTSSRPSVRGSSSRLEAAELGPCPGGPGSCSTFVSDEFNGKNYGPGDDPAKAACRGQLDVVPAKPPAQCRQPIYLGVHWKFDADDGIALGVAVAEDAFV